MAKRKAIPKSVRFEVLKRDSFKCQYCGASAPAVLLHIDHIKPVANGGTNDITNLISACADCNAGKSDKPLSQNAAVTKSKAQLDAIQERREQLEMIMQWQESLKGLEDQIIDRLGEHWKSLTIRFELTEKGRAGLRSLVKKWGVEPVMTVMSEAAERYLHFTENGPTQASAETAFNKISVMLGLRKAIAENPELKDLFYIRAILKNRIGSNWGWKDKTRAMDDLKYVLSRCGNECLEMLTDAAKKCNSWEEFVEHERAILVGFETRRAS